MKLRIVPGAFDGSEHRPSALTPLLLLVLLTHFVSAQQPVNLSRNGSFEGSLLYWHNVDQDEQTLVQESKVGKYALRMAGGWVMSAPVVAERDAHYTISLWAKSVDKPGRISVAMPPAAREVGQKSGRVWTKGAGQGADLTTDWQRLSFTFAADVKTTGFWPLPHYMVMISGGKSVPILVDGVTVTRGAEAVADYVPQRDVEVVAECLNLPGYAGAAGNIFEPGATVEMRSHVANPGREPRQMTVRWQLIDYERARPLSDPVDQQVTLQPGQTISQTTPLPLAPKGCVIARLSALDAEGQVIDSSDFPLTSLPYPKGATQPDYRERFGGSFAGGVGCLDKFQRIGFGWTRWWPETKWHSFQPDGPDSFDWQDDKFQAAFDRGVSCHVVLYGWPKWIMDKNHRLPRDMRWPADDPRWDDLTVETAWDRYVKEAARHFQGKSVVFQVANEPGHDRWENYLDEYVKFNVRTARLIKQVDPRAKVSINNVYLNPSYCNLALLRSRQLEHFDVWSWHDYHSGWLTDADGIRRMRAMLDGAGGQHMEIWFTEGWAFTNTLVDQPIACTSLTSAQSTNAIIDCLAEISAAGHDKTVIFHTAYESHGMSFWDYSGPGTMLWDWYGNPLPLVAAWNVLNHHIGLSDEIGLVRPPGVNFAIFRDLRNERGVMIAYADRNAKEDVVVDLPMDGLTAEDIMGNPEPLSGRRLTLSKTGRPIVLYAADQTVGKMFYDQLEPLDRRHLGFVTRGEGAAAIYQLPLTWEGSQQGQDEGNPVTADGKPVWRLDHLYPTDSLFPDNYSPMVWNKDRWKASHHSQGGHPSAKVADGNVHFGAMGPWGGQDFNYRKVGVLAFIAPEDGLYRVTASAKSKPWDGKRPAIVEVRKKDTQRAGELTRFDVPPDNKPVAIEFEVDLAAGHELLFLSVMPHHNNASNITLSNLKIVRGPVADALQTRELDDQDAAKVLGKLRTWKDRSGQHSLSAKLIGATSDKAQLEKSDGTVVIVPFDKFSEQDQEILREVEGRSSQP